MNLRGVDWIHLVHLIHQEGIQGWGSCEQGKESSGCIKGTKFTEKLNDFRFSSKSFLYIRPGTAVKKMDNGRRWPQGP
jgi:hypothetical protein